MTRPVSQRQVEIIEELHTVSRTITEHSRRVLACEPADWALMAEQLAIAARLCRSQDVVKLTDIGDSGSR